MVSILVKTSATVYRLSRTRTHAIFTSRGAIQGWGNRRGNRTSDRKITSENSINVCIVRFLPGALLGIESRTVVVGTTRPSGETLSEARRKCPWSQHIRFPIVRRLRLSLPFDDLHGNIGVGRKIV